MIDGTSHTIFIGEKLLEKPNADNSNRLGWISGTRAALRNTGGGPNEGVEQLLNGEGPPPGGKQQRDATFVGGFSSPHPGGIHVGMGDGGVRFVSQNIDPQLFRHLGNRSDGELVGDF